VRGATPPCLRPSEWVISCFFYSGLAEREIDVLRLLVLDSSEKERLGLRRTETARLDLADGSVIPPRRSSAGPGMLHVRHGKAVRGRSPRRRNVASVTGWAGEAVADYVENIRPGSGRWIIRRCGSPSGAARSSPRFGCRHSGVLAWQARSRQTSPTLARAAKVRLCR
jgi:hypothetical protein